jgi:SAM-dependent methyltransferase
MNLDVGSGGGPYNWRPRAEICLSWDIPPFKVKEEVIKGDAHNLPFRDKQFNTVFAFNLLEHVQNPWKVLSELTRVGLTVKIRQDTIFNIANFATPEHLWFQLRGLRFLPYPRTRIGILVSKALRVLITQSIPKLRHHHLLMKFLLPFLPPHQQYDVWLFKQ